MYYYANLDERNIVINVTSSSTPLTGTNIIAITQDQFNDPDSIMGMYYDPEDNVFIIPPIHVLAETTTSKIQYKAEEKWLDQKLDEIEENIENIELTPGADGLSAYEVAKENGFTGTQAQWLASLVGPHGAKGDKGDKGDTGATGPQGPKGAQGPTGATGATGPQGLKGDTGATGASGATFTPSVSSAGVLSWSNNKGLSNPSSVNIKGPKGDTGATGSTGAQGPQGIQGPKGDKGDKGDKGATGATGATGPQGPAGQNAASAFEGYSPSDFAGANHTHSDLETAKSRGQIGNSKNITKAGEDLDNYIYPGVYTFAASYAPAHIPAGNNGWLVVLRWPTSDDNATVKQLWFRHGSVGVNDYETYVRTKLGNNAFGQWSKFYTSSNPPTAEEVGAIDKSLQMTSDDGDVSESWTNQDVISKIISLPSGVHTAYARGNTTGNPKTSESWRYIIHKTGSANYGWVQAFGSSSSMYIGYVDNGAWKGWKCIYDAAPGRLWSGAKLVKANETITPTKKLSECKTGWILMWSDWNVETSEPSETDIATTLVPKKNALGNNWTGQSLYALLPTYVTTAQAVTIACKRLNIYNNRVTGFTLNNAEPANDVVLRAIYEY